MVSAVILAYNRSHEVIITIEKLKQVATRLPFALEIIVVDNASIDDTSEKVKQLHSDIILVTKTVNNGIAGWNDGFSIANGDYFLVLDDDSHIESGLPAAVSYMEQNQSVGILALNITGGNYETSNWKNLKEAIGFIGCGALIRREVYNKIGGFSEWIHLYGHEWEYGIRCIDAGYKILYFQDSNVVHRTSAVNRTLKRVRVFSTRNEMGIVYKYFRNNRAFYIFRVFVNSCKMFKSEGPVSVYYSLLGAIEFLKIKKTLVHTPVSKQTQDFFAGIFWGTKPIFAFVEKRINKLLNKSHQYE